MAKLKATSVAGDLTVTGKVTSTVAGATTSTIGTVKLNDAINDASTTTAATANAVKKAYDLASGKTSPTGTIVANRVAAFSDTTGKVIKDSGHTIATSVPANAKFTDTNTWRPVVDDLTSAATDQSLSANQGKILKGLVDGKAASSHGTHVSYGTSTTSSSYGGSAAAGTSSTVSRSDHKHALPALPTASTSASGIVKLNSATNSVSTTEAATASAVKAAYDKGNHSHPYLSSSGGTIKDAANGDLAIGAGKIISTVPSDSEQKYTGTFDFTGLKVEANGDVTGGGQLYSYSTNVSSKNIEIIEDNSGNANQCISGTKISGGKINLSRSSDDSTLDIDTGGIIRRSPENVVPDWTAANIGTAGKNEDIRAWVGKIGGSKTLCPAEDGGINLGCNSRKWWDIYSGGTLNIGEKGFIQYKNNEGVLELGHKDGNSPIHIGILGMVPKGNNDMYLGASENRWKEVMTNGINCNYTYFQNPSFSSDIQSGIADAHGDGARSLTLRINGKMYQFTDSWHGFHGYNAGENLGTSYIPWGNVFLSGRNLETTGYTKLPNGLYLQWGQVTIGAPPGSWVETIVNLPIASPGFSRTYFASANAVQGNMGNPWSYLEDVRTPLNLLNNSQIKIRAFFGGNIPAPSSSGGYCYVDIKWVLCCEA